jgi:hypothetical protein
MRVFVSALVLLAIVIVYGCESNDNNTVNSIPKYHNVYPVFHVKIDNGYRTFGVDSAQLTVTPEIGWLGPAYTDPNGFLGTMASGTFISKIDTVDTTIDNIDTTVVDTSYVVFGFTPSQKYTFDFSRSEPFTWRDSFRADFVTTIDSQWLLLSADTTHNTNILDPGHPPESVLYKVVKNPASTLNPPPNRVETLSVLYGKWFDTLFAVTDSAGTAAFPPDTFIRQNVRWGFWYRVDSFYLPPDPEVWCDSMEYVETVDTFITVTYDTFTVVDTVAQWLECDPHMDTTKVRIYRNYGWGTYASNGQPIPRLDTTTHFAFLDTAKALDITPSGLTIYTLEISPDSLDTVAIDTSGVDIYFIQNGDTTAVNNLIMDLTMPPVEVFPAYRYLLKQQTP